MANQLIEINQIIKEILDKTATGLPVKPYVDNPDQISFAFKHEIARRNDKLQAFIHEFNIFNSFIDDATLGNILISLRKILLHINVLNGLPITDLEQASIEGGGLLEEINQLPDIYNSHFYNTGNINIPAIKSLLIRIQDSLQLFGDLNIDLILSEANYSELNDILLSILAIHNEYVFSPDSPHLPRLSLEAYKVLKAVSDKSKKIESTNTIEELGAQAIEIKEKFGLVSSEQLIEAFRKEALSYEKDIKTYNELILTVFSIIIFILAILVILVMFTDFLHEIKVIQFYGFYISLFIFLSTFLTYLIRERKRLLNNQHYSNISHLELLALPLYVAQLSDKTKQDDLIVHLSSRYFLGPNPSSNNEEATNNITTDKLSEVIKLAQEIKSTMKS